MGIPLFLYRRTKLPRRRPIQLSARIATAVVAGATSSEEEYCWASLVSGV
jgi:hypothetical protein